METHIFFEKHSDSYINTHLNLLTSYYDLLYVVDLLWIFNRVFFFFSFFCRSSKQRVLPSFPSCPFLSFEPTYMIWYIYYIYIYIYSSFASSLSFLLLSCLSERRMEHFLGFFCLFCCVPFVFCFCFLGGGGGGHCFKGRRGGGPPHWLIGMTTRQERSLPHLDGNPLRFVLWRASMWNYDMLCYCFTMRQRRLILGPWAHSQAFNALWALEIQGRKVGPWNLTIAMRALLRFWMLHHYRSMN